MRAIAFNDGWSFRRIHNDPSMHEDVFTPVSIPHDAMLTEPRTVDAPSGANSGWFEGSDYEYVTHFAPGPDVDGKTVLIEFEGVYRDAEVWLNGTRLASRPYGYTNFTVELTDRLKEENEIRVIARNSSQPNSRWYTGAGIYRPVTLWVGERTHVKHDGLTVRTLSISPVLIEVTVRTSGPGAVTVELNDPATGHTIATTTTQSDGECAVTLEAPDLALWSPDSPTLYTCSARIASGTGSDTAQTTFGARTIEWGANGFLINGERTILRGACVHHDNGVLGARAYADAEERKVRLMQENGYNALRSAHNPCSKALLNACDRLGMLVMDEYIDHWYIHKTRFDYTEHFDKWWEQDLRDMVAKDINHPSVIMYSIGNEVSETAEKRGIELTRNMTQHLHRLDPTRPVTCGVNIFFNFLSSIGFGVYSDKKAAKEAEKADRGKATKAVGSEFFNNLAGKLGANFMKRGATLPPCDWKTRDAFAALDIAGYNYGILRYERDLKKYPGRLILGTETFCTDAYAFWEFAKKNPRMIGDFVWSGMDYLGEVGVGAWEYSDYAPEFSGLGWLTAGSGRVDITGRPLGEALYTRVALERETGPLIAVRPVNRTGEPHSPSAWKMSNAIDTWSWNGCEGRTAHVEVYARAASVELRINGATVASKNAAGDCITRFECTWQPGVLEAIARDGAGHEIGRSQLRSASETTQLRAEPEEAEVAPTGVSFVRLRYTDENGIGKPLERGTISVRVTDGELLGLGSAAPFNARGYVHSDTDTYYGEALAVVQPSPGARNVTIHADDGTRNVSVTIPVADGSDDEH